MDVTRQDQSHRRMFALAAFLLMFTAATVGHLAYLQLRLPQVIPPDPTGTQNVKPKRGSIYDSHGYLLAVSTTVYDVGALPYQIKDKEVLADRLASLLGQPRSEILAQLQKDDGYAPLKRGVSKEVAQIIDSWHVSGLQAEPRASRVYPHGALAVAVLGFVNEEQKASHGVEARYDDELGGQPGYRVAAGDAMGSTLYRFYSPRHGVDLYLTLDRNIQYLVEEALAKGVTRVGAREGLVVVMEPKTGAILAMAVYPTYDPNTRAVTDASLFVNNTVSATYEPGSVFKVFTIASALDAGTITPSSTYYDEGQIVIGGRTIKNSDGLAYGQVSIPNLLAYSLNVGSATVSTQMGARRFYEYVRRFGFGQLTGVDLAQETAGWVRAPGNPEWHESDLGTNSFGQGLAATPLQVLTAICAVANDGAMMRPYIVARTVDGTTVTETAPRVLRQVVSSEAAQQTTEMLVHAVDNVNAVHQAVAISGYSIAGKSGTSQVYMPSGGYDPRETIASFAGFAPADDPRFAILVVLDRPQNEQWGTQAAGPVFREIALQLLTLLAVPPDSVRLGLASLPASGARSDTPRSLTLAHLWRAVGTGPWPWAEGLHRPLHDVVVDSRQATEGSLFVALPGEHTDGHCFVGDAFQRGARAALVHRPVADGASVLDVTQPLPADTELRLPVCLQVQNTLTTLQALATYWRAQHPQCRVVGITGSVGKTTTKELIAAVLRQRFCTLSSPENYNNEIGLPLSVLRLGPGVEWLAQEIAMYDVGEIALLSRIARPEFGVVTNVGPTHLERLGSMERIAQAKAELVQALPEHGLALLNGDDPRVRAMATLTPARQVVFYGLERDNDLWADDVQTHGLEGLSLRLHWHGDVLPARLPVLGRHSAYRVLAAAGVGLGAGMAWEQVIAGLQDPAAQVRLLVVPGIRGTTILDDAYNASPASTTAALDLLADVVGTPPRADGAGRKVAVLGGMLELGSFEQEGHRLVGRRAAETVSLLVTVGKLGRLIAEEALAHGLPPADVHSVDDNDGAVEILRQILVKGDVVLVKGSRGIAMENIVAQLRRRLRRDSRRGVREK